MPNLNGFDATRRIRQLEAQGSLTGPKRPIIALTATRGGDRDRCLEAGMDDYLSKLIDPDLMVQIIEKHLMPPQESASEPPIQMASLLKRCRGKQTLVEQVLSTFVSTVPNQLQALDQALAAEVRNRPVRLAHSLKGAAAEPRCGACGRQPPWAWRNLPERETSGCRG